MKQIVIMFIYYFTLFVSSSQSSFENDLYLQIINEYCGFLIPVEVLNEFYIYMVELTRKAFYKLDHQILLGKVVMFGLDNGM